MAPPEWSPSSSRHKLTALTDPEARRRPGCVFEILYSSCGCDLFGSKTFGSDAGTKVFTCIWYGDIHGPEPDKSMQYRRGPQYFTCLQAKTIAHVIWARGVWGGGGHSGLAGEVWGPLKDHALQFAP
jgi:hypothetical protein